jgi:hypothetical protein
MFLKEIRWKGGGGTELIWLRRGTSDGLFWVRLLTSDFNKISGISWIAKERLASQGADSNANNDPVTIITVPSTDCREYSNFSVPAAPTLVGRWALVGRQVWTEAVGNVNGTTVRSARCAQLWYEVCLQLRSTVSLWEIGLRLLYESINYFTNMSAQPRDTWVPVTTAWCILRLLMEDRPPT